MSETRSYKKDLLEALTDPVEAKEYLNAALEDEDSEVFILAVQDVFEANRSVGKSTEDLNQNKDISFETLTKQDNFQLSSIRSILNQIGFKLAVEVD